jgi:CheY-like chemotaxis protein
LLHVINDILDFSKIESGNLEIEQQEFDLRQCIENVLDVFAGKAASQDIDLVYQLDPLLPATIVGDSLRLRQILINFVGNAIKFTHKGEVFIDVNSGKSSGDLQEVQFHVRDTGIGIPKDKLGKLFKAFSQVDSSTTRKYGGTGLGLIICERLIKLMGGVVSVSSEVGIGTTFSFYIQTKVVEALEKPLPENTKITEGKKVLIIDDNTTLLKTIKNELELLKLKTASASSRQEVLAFINSEEPFDAVILDMQMPQINPVNVAKAIKNINPKLPIIPLSYVGNEEISKYPGLFRPVLTKPVKQVQLLKLVQTALREGEGEKVAQEVSNRTNILNEDFAASYPLSILIAEDNLVNQKIAAHVLNKLGYEPEIANDGQETVEMFKAKLHDVILMDMQMPVVDGIEATKIIRSCQLVKQPQIIAMTANAMAEDRERCLKEGMNDYISKPVKLEELIDILKNASMMVKLQAQL